MLASRRRRSILSVRVGASPATWAKWDATLGATAGSILVASARHRRPAYKSRPLVASVSARRTASVVSNSRGRNPAGMPALARCASTARACCGAAPGAGPTGSTGAALV